MNQCTRFTPCPIISASTWMGWKHTFGVPFCHASHHHTTRAHFSSIYIPQRLYEQRAASHTERASIRERDALAHKGDEKGSHYELLCHKWVQITLSALLTISHGTEPWNRVYSVISFRGLLCKGLTMAETHLEAGRGSLSLLQMLGCCVFGNQMVAQGFKEEPVSEEEEKLKV